MKNHRFLWLRNRTTNNRKCEKARNIKEKRTIEMFNTDLKQLVELHSSQNVNFSYARDNLRNSDLRSNPCFTRVCGVVRCGEKRWNLLSSQRICNTFATKISKKYRTLFGDRHWRVSFLLCRFCISSYAILIF
jgi:hypothetical protein